MPIKGVNKQNKAQKYLDAEDESSDFSYGEEKKATAAGYVVKKTELMLAVERGSLAFVQHYIGQAGIRLRYSKNNREYVTCALIMAAQFNFHEAIPLLAPAELGILPKYGDNAFIAAARMGNVVCLQELLKFRKAKTIQRTSIGETALMAAASGGHTRCCRLLLVQAGQQTQKGQSALMMATANNFYQTAQLLVDYEAGLQNKSGQTALHHINPNAENIEQFVQLLGRFEAGLIDQTGCTASRKEPAILNYMPPFVKQLEFVAQKAVNRQAHQIARRREVKLMRQNGFVLEVLQNSIAEFEAAQIIARRYLSRSHQISLQLSIHAGATLALHDKLSSFSGLLHATIRILYSEFE